MLPTRYRDKSRETLISEGPELGPEAGSMSIPKQFSTGLCSFSSEMGFGPVYRWFLAPIMPQAERGGRLVEVGLIGRFPVKR